MKKAFTMIELIFVIVIIGIISSIALPKLSATRDDAAITANLASLRQAIDNAKTAYMADKNGFKSVARSWLGNRAGYTKMGPDGACFLVVSYKNYNQITILPHINSWKTNFSTCSLSESNKNILFNKAKKIGLLNTTTTTTVIYFNGRRMTF